MNDAYRETVNCINCGKSVYIEKFLRGNKKSSTRTRTIGNGKIHKCKSGVKVYTPKEIQEYINGNM